MGKPRSKITERDMRIVADVLTQFMFTRNMEDVMKVWGDVYEQYDLRDDPFTHTPCTRKEFYENCLEYDRQTMIERYGHCDGLE